VVGHILSRLDNEMVYEIKRDYLIGDFSSIFTVRYRLVNKLIKLADAYFKINPLKSFTTLKDLFTYFYEIYATKSMNSSIRSFKYLETFNFFQLLLLEQELKEFKFS
jgi:hypothetical protein